MLAPFGMLPGVIYPAAATARTGTSGAGTHAIVQSVDRRWVRVEAARLEGHDGGQIAVTLRAATAAETLHLLCRAYALSQRERQVVAAVVAGLDTPRDRGPPLHLPLHGAGPPQVGVHEDGGPQPPRADRAIQRRHETTPTARTLTRLHHSTPNTPAPPTRLRIGS